MGKLKLYIVDLEEYTINRLEELFYSNTHLGVEVAGYAHSYISALNELGSTKDIDVYLVSAYLPDQMGFDLIPNIKKVNPNAKIIVMVTKETRNLAEISKEKGADEVIQKQSKVKVLLDTIEDLVGTEVMNKAREDVSGAKVPRVFQPEEEEEMTQNVPKRTLFETYTSENTGFIPSEDEMNLHDKPKRVVVFYSTSSAGKTSLITNIAAAIHKHSELKPKICIVDFNLLFPSIAYKFHQDDLIMCKRSIYDVCEDINDMDENLIKQALITHEPTGIQILNTPSEMIRGSHRITADGIDHLLMNLKEMFDLILIETSHNIKEDTTIYPITTADKNIILVEPDITSLIHTRKFVSMIKEIENNTNEKITTKFSYVLNKSNSKTGVHVEDVKKTLFNAEVRVQIPEDQNITFYANNGQFVVDNSTASYNAIMDLANLVYPIKEDLGLGIQKSNKSSSVIVNAISKISESVKKKKK